MTVRGYTIMVKNVKMGISVEKWVYAILAGITGLVVLFIFGAFVLLVR